MKKTLSIITIVLISVSSFAQNQTKVSEIHFNDNSQTLDLVWATENELPNSYFKVEKSYDGKHWNYVGMVDGSEDKSQRNYLSLEMEKEADNVQYRIVQVNFRGKKEVYKNITYSGQHHFVANAE